MALRNKAYYFEISRFLEKNSLKIVLIIGVFLMMQHLLTLPYLNLLGRIFQYLPHVVSFIFGLLLLRPDKNILLIIALILFILAYPFILLNIVSISETLGVFSYFLLTSYVVIAVRELFFGKR